MQVAYRGGLILGGFGWASALWNVPNVFGQAPGLAEGVAEEDLDLGVDAAKIISCPAGEGIVDRWV